MMHAVSERVDGSGASASKNTLIDVEGAHSPVEELACLTVCTAWSACFI